MLIKGAFIKLFAIFVLLLQSPKPLNPLFMLEKEFQYFINNQAELVKQYNGKHLVIKGEEVIGVYDSEIEAFLNTKRAHTPGTFLIQLCKPGNDSYTQVFHTRVVFA